MISTVTATPEQVERQWDSLTDWQRDQIRLARSLGKSILVTVADFGEHKAIYSLDVLS